MDLIMGMNSGSSFDGIDVILQIMHISLMRPARKRL